MEDDWTTIRWDKVNSLSGGTTQYGPGLGMTPWYLASFNTTAPTSETTTPSSPFNVVSVTSSPAVSTTPASPINTTNGERPGCSL